MKRPFTSAALFLLVFAWASARASTSPTLEVSGMVVFGNLKAAVLVMDGSLIKAGRSFVLTEGETRYGIRLLSVDMLNRRVQVDNGGEKLVLSIGRAHDVTAMLAEMAAAQAAASVQERDGVQLPPSTEVNTALIPGNPGWGTLPLNTPVARAAAAANAQTPDTPSKSPAVASDPNVLISGDAGNPDSLTDSSWYEASQRIERKRIATSAEVLSGEMSPLPRTPLTPPGTPLDLVDNANGVFANHSPDFLVQDWSHL